MSKHSANLSPCAALPLAKLPASELLTIIGSVLAIATFSVTIDDKGSRAAEYMSLGTILDESLTRNAYVKYLFGMRIDIVACTKRSTRMYIGSVKYKA